MIEIINATLWQGLLGSKYDMGSLLRWMRYCEQYSFVLFSSWFPYSRLSRDTCYDLSYFSTGLTFNLSNDEKGSELNQVYFNVVITKKNNMGGV